MRKKRSIVYVRPGKDVTLYVPAETPPEVIDYLNQLKQEGMFSQGVMDIVTEYVQEHVTRSDIVSPQTFEDENPFETADLENDLRDEELDVELNHSLDAYNEGDSPKVAAATEEKLDLAQIFRQAQLNAGKMKSGSNL